MKKFFAAILCFVFIYSFSALPAFAEASKNPENQIIMADESNDWVIVNDEDGIYAIRFFTKDNLPVTPRYVSTQLYAGNRSLSTNVYSSLCTKPSRSGVFNNEEVVELWNGGDDQGNGAVTFKVGSSTVAIDSNTGAQIKVKQKASYAISATANWYNGTYYLSVTNYHY